MSGTTSAKPDYTLPYEQKVLSILRDFGIVRAQLFGSAARGELTPASDIDLLVKPDGPVDYGQLFLLQEALEAATGRSFDILTSIKEPFRPYIEPELIELPLRNHQCHTLKWQLKQESEFYSTHPKLKMSFNDP